MYDWVSLCQSNNHFKYIQSGFSALVLYLIESGHNCRFTPITNTDSNNSLNLLYNKFDLHFILFSLLKDVPVNMAHNCSTGVYNHSSKISYSLSFKCFILVFYCNNKVLDMCSLHTKDTNLKGQKFEFVSTDVWCLMCHWLWLLYLWLHAPSISINSSQDKVRRLWHDPLSSWKIVFDDDGRCCPIFCVAPLGTVLTHPSSRGWKREPAAVKQLH